MQNYSTLQKFLHDFVLSKKIINKSLFELEKMIYLKNTDTKNQSHLFITGLPRNDLFDTETRMGLFKFIALKFCKIVKSR